MECVGQFAWKTSLDFAHVCLPQCRRDEMRHCQSRIEIPVKNLAKAQTVFGWGAENVYNRDEEKGVMADWELASQGETVFKIDPLK